ncbi:MAG: hypothetical protein M3Q60_08430, partial [Actinomycetota bacterium]|nr:hypothetical protein [Actinomycetota bacterium]
MLLFTTMAIMVSSYAGAALSAPVNEVEPNDSTAQAQNIDRYFSLDNNPEISNSTTVPHATVNGTGNDTFDYYSFTVPEAGVTTSLGVLDIDGAMFSFDSWLELYNGAGTLLERVMNSDGGSGSM